MQRFPAWLWPPPVWLWPRHVSSTPNGLQRLGRVLHWGLSGLAFVLAGFAVMIAAGALFAVVKSDFWELVGSPVPKDLKWVEMRLETPVAMKPRAEGPVSVTDQTFRSDVADLFQEALRRGLTPPEDLRDAELIAREAATSDWKVTRKSTEATRLKERSLTRARARVELQRALAALPSAISTALGLMLGALASALVGRASRYVISGE
ncbi:MAG: hypothetical protein IM664_04195 [Phenylobacterium sp.]|uniref:hypothetical protein n=1 Tax=Phenylobacterium sp. TaxID=1871053 RepID=UPI0025D81E21|nr:hypothetical protein [Phenylobacterium sp.]MCA6333796.1 hypothetical protein [Phenylobacterium sp.]